MVRGMRSFALLLALALTACAQPKTRPPMLDSNQVRMEQNYQGQLVAKEELLIKEGQAQRRIEMESRLLKISGPVARAGIDLCHRMQLQTKDMPCVFDYQLTEEKQPLNAFADGQHIFVTPAMMRFAEKDEELAFILAHETAHNLMRHQSAMSGNRIMGALLGALADGAAAYGGVNTKGNFTKAGMDIATLSYSSAFEQEADYVGLYLLANAGVDYRQAPGFWRRMSIREPEAIYISTTHPSNSERFVNMTQVIQEIDQKKAKHLALLPEMKQVASNPKTPPNRLSGKR